MITSLAGKVNPKSNFSQKTVVGGADEVSAAKADAGSGAGALEAEAWEQWAKPVVDALEGWLDEGMEPGRIRSRLQETAPDTDALAASFSAVLGSGLGADTAVRKGEKVAAAHCNQYGHKPGCNRGAGVDKRHAREGETKKRGKSKPAENKSLAPAPLLLHGIKANTPVSTWQETEQRLKSVVEKTMKLNKGKKRGLPGRGFLAPGMDKEFYITNHSICELTARNHVIRSADPESHYTAAAMAGELWEASEPMSQYRDKKLPYAKSAIEWMHKRKACIDIRGRKYDVEITAKEFKHPDDDPMLYQVRTKRRQ